ncbi:MAG: FHA domain-containing protein, partial [Myxococcales bacterium]|nr:FHA domain-containing protein [Myxococcales bacterium]
MSDDWNDDLESTRVSDIDKLREELTRRSQRDRAYLIVLAGTDVGKMFKLLEGETVVGRSHRSDIRLDDDSISRMHVKLTL